MARRAIQWPVFRVAKYSYCCEVIAAFSVRCCLITCVPAHRTSTSSERDSASRLRGVPTVFNPESQSQIAREGAREVILSSVKTPERFVLNVPDALHAICSTGKGRCWYCDRRLPRLPQALRAGWDVQRVEGERVASIILICPRCQLKTEGLEIPERSVAAGI